VNSPTVEVLLPRGLATRLLHAAQVAPAALVRGVVLADASGAPAEFAPDGAPGGRIWAAFLGGAPGEPAPDATLIADAARHAPRVLVAALDVQGVLRLELHQRVGTGLVRTAVGIVEG
jgi:hypothetical protein